MHPMGEPEGGPLSRLLTETARRLNICLFASTYGLVRRADCSEGRG